MTKIDGRAEIVFVAKTLFKEKGFHGTSMRLIAKELGVRVSTIYAHINSKNDILTNICFDIGNKFIAMLEKLEAQQLEPSIKLEKFIKNHLIILTSNLDSIEIYSKEWKYMNDSDIAKFKKLIKKYEDGLTNILNDGIKKECFIYLNATLSSKFILSSLNNFEYLKPYSALLIEKFISQISLLSSRVFLKKNYEVI